MIKYIIEGAPVTKKNSMRMVMNKQTGKMFPMPSKQYKEYEATAALFLTPKPEMPLDMPLAIKCDFYMPTRRLCDLTNLLEAVDDILVRHKIIADDNYKIVVSHDGSRVYYDKERPRTEIKIEEYEDG